MTNYENLIVRLSYVFKKNSLELCRLDSNAGDGDHGLTMERGFTKAEEKIISSNENYDMSSYFKEIGYSILASMGGASGPIFSTMFIQWAIEMKDKKEFTSKNFIAIIKKTIDAIYELIGTKKGDKTMVDALYGAYEKIQDQENLPLNQILKLAHEGACEGADSTKGLIAKKGRAKFLGERSKGFIDAGAMSVSLILKTVYEVLGEKK